MLGRLTRAARLFSRGQKLVAQGDFEAALDAFAQALTLRPRAAGISLHWALALAEADRLPEAIEAMRQAIARQPANPVLPMFLGQIYFDHADYAQARAWCERALALQPHNTHAVALHTLTDMARGEIAQGYQCLKHPPPLPTTALERGLLRLRKGGPPSLLHLTNAAFQSRLLLFAEAYLLQQGGRGRTLLQQLVETCTGGAAAPQTHRYVAALDRLCTRGAMGIKRLYIRLRYTGQPTRQTLWRRHTDAEAAYYLGQTTTALSRSRQLLQQAPDLLAARQLAFEICYEQGDFRHALQHFRRLVAQNTPAAAPDAWQSLVLGELLYQQGHYHEADACLARAATLRLRDYKLFYYLGLCRLRAGALREARRQFAQAVHLLHPGITEMRLNEMYRVHQSLPSG